MRLIIDQIIIIDGSAIGLIHAGASPVKEGFTRRAMYRETGRGHLLLSAQPGRRRQGRTGHGGSSGHSIPSEQKIPNGFPVVSRAVACILCSGETRAAIQIRTVHIQRFLTLEHAVTRNLAVSPVSHCEDRNGAAPFQSFFPTNLLRKNHRVPRYDFSALTRLVAGQRAA